MCKGILKNDKYTFIIGCGDLGINLAIKLENNNENVILIDKNEDSFKFLPSNFSGRTLVANGTDIDILKSLMIENAKSVIAVTNDDDVNIMVALLAKEMFGIKNVVLRLYNIQKKIIYSDFDIETICPTFISSDAIINLISQNQE